MSPETIYHCLVLDLIPRWHGTGRSHIYTVPDQATRSRRRAHYLVEQPTCPHHDPTSSVLFSNDTDAHNLQLSASSWTCFTYLHTKFSPPPPAPASAFYAQRTHRLQPPLRSYSCWRSDGPSQVPLDAAQWEEDEVGEVRQPEAVLEGGATTSVKGSLEPYLRTTVASAAAPRCGGPGMLRAG